MCDIYMYENVLDKNSKSAIYERVEEGGFM